MNDEGENSQREIIDNDFERSDQVGRAKLNVQHNRLGSRDRGSISVNNTNFLYDPKTDDRQNERASATPRDRRDSTFIAIDLYGRDRSEYVFSCFVLSIMQVPILLSISELILGQKIVSSYEVAYGISLL